MTADLAFQPARHRGWLSGLPAPLLWHEIGAFWGTRTWWVQLGAWTLLVRGLLLNSLAQAHHGAPGTEFISVGMGTFGALGMIVITHNAIVGEKQSGTAAWIMSKPVSRGAFILAKFLGTLTGTLTIVIAVEGTAAYAAPAAAGHSPAALAYLQTMAAVAIYLLFFTALSLCLGTIFTSRGPVLAIPLLALLAAQLLHFNLASIGAALLPAGHSQVSVSANSGGSAATAALAVSAIYLVLIIALLAGAIARFTREQF
jgi:ABC-2 type transport system permease protein